MFVCFFFLLFLSCFCKECDSHLAEVGEAIRVQTRHLSRFVFERPPSTPFVYSLPLSLSLSFHLISFLCFFFASPSLRLLFLGGSLSQLSHFFLPLLSLLVKEEGKKNVRISAPRPLLDLALHFFKKISFSLILLGCRGGNPLF